MRISITYLRKRSSSDNTHEDFMPQSRHLSNRHFWQFFLVFKLMTQLPPFRHMYCFVLWFWIDLLKNARQLKKIIQKYKSQNQFFLYKYKKINQISVPRVIVTSHLRSRNEYKLFLPKKPADLSWLTNQRPGFWREIAWIHFSIYSFLWNTTLKKCLPKARGCSIMDMFCSCFTTNVTFFRFRNQWIIVHSWCSRIFIPTITTWGN